jgi:hypothetical protein
MRISLICLVIALALRLAFDHLTAQEVFASIVASDCYRIAVRVHAALLNHAKADALHNDSWCSVSLCGRTES